MKNKNITYRNLFTISSFIILAVLSNIIFIHSHTIFDAWDMQFHLKRITELISSFNHMSFSPFSFNQFNGSSVMGMYPYINLFPIILLSYLIKSKITLIYIFFGSNTFISLLICFFSSRSISKNIWTSYVFSIIYSLSTVLIGYNYFFMDIGMTSVVTFLPLVIFGTIHLLKDNHYIELILGISLIAFSHILSIFIIGIFLLIFLMINYSKWTKKLWKNIIKSLCITSLITSFVWIPILSLFINNVINTPTPLKLQGLPNKIILKSIFGGTDPMGSGTFVIISIILFPFFWHKFTELIKQCYIISIITIIISSKLFPWQLLPNFIANPLAHFQFTYRFLIVPILLLDYIFALIITQLINKKEYRYSLICVSLLGIIGLRLMAQQHFINKRSNYPNFALINRNEITSINYKMTNNHQISNLIKFRPNDMNKNGYAMDYYPKSAISKVNYINNNKGIYDNDHTLNIKHVGYNQFSFNNKNKINTLTLPLLHYHGEHLHLDLDHHLIPYYANKNSLITINHVKIGYHKLKIKYLPNIWLVLLKSVLFIIGMLWLILIWIKNWVSKRKLRINNSN